MENHKMLKEICDNIGYKINKLYITYENIGCYYSFVRIINDKYIPIDVREIIFTKEFMDCFIDYCLIKGIEDKGFAEGLLENLNDPVSYLYNLLGLGKQ